MNITRRALGALLIAGGVVGLILSSYLAFIVWNPITGITTMSEAVNIATNYLNSLNNKNLAIDEIEEYQYNFYIVYYEKSTGIGAFEMIIDKPSTSEPITMWGYGDIRPEPGPNMMWNTKYGMMGFTTGATTITVDQAKGYAQGYLDSHIAGAKVGDVHIFYGFYTLDIMKDGKIYGMLSVNAYTGDVWYHNWHGAYIRTREMKIE